MDHTDSGQGQGQGPDGGQAPLRALVVGASGGIGGALAAALQARGVAVTTLSRSTDGLDITQEATVAAAAERLAAAGAAPFDWILSVTGALSVAGADPERAFRELQPDILAQSFAINAVGPAMVMKHFAPLLHPDRTRRTVLAVLSARVGSIGDNHLGGWMSYRAAKAALNQLVRCASIEIARKRPHAVVVALHPGTIETALTRPYARGRYTATPDQAAQDLLGVLDRLTPQDSGGFFAYDGQPIPW